MRKLRVGIIDILGKSASRKPYSKYMRANNQSIMPQVVAVWCQQLGHDPHMAYYDGPDLLVGGVPDDADVVFINAFSQTAMLAYALSSYFRARGAVTVLGGPHARSYPEHAVQYFDYALGFTDKSIIQDVLQDCSAHRPEGQYLSAAQQPTTLPGVHERWSFMKPVLDYAKILKIIPIIGSLGCPYTCSFCVDSIVPYQPLDYDVLKDELRFLLKHKLPRSAVVWHDPNFGIRFEEYMDVIEEAVPPGSLTFIGETSLSRLKEPQAKRLAYNGFKAMAPGIESWYDIGDKSRMRSVKGMEKVERVAEHINMVQSYIPYMQANLIFGLDADEGPEPFELTKRFIDLAPGAYPHFSLLMSYGRNAPDNLKYQRANRVLNIPFHYLNQLHSMNVRPQNYTWPEFFGHVCDVYAYAYSWKAIARRFHVVKHFGARMEKTFRGITSERQHKHLQHQKMLRHTQDPALQPYFNGETNEIPELFTRAIQEDLGWLWEWLPKEAIYHNPNAYVESLEGAADPAVKAGMVVA